MKLAAFAGSARKESLNRRLLEAAVAIARARGAEVDLFSLAEFQLPIFDEDLEAEGFPAGATALKERLKAADGFLIASPEYNGGLPALLKNAIDWASRRAGDEKSLMAFDGKACGLFAASPGRLGGVRMLPHLRVILSGIGVQVAPAMFGLHASCAAC
ncbi:MAG: NAD(P)H-dependent oxidoreductase, partial [Planctomycetota bacterium]